MSRQDSNLQRWIERPLLATGLALILVYASARIRTVVSITPACGVLQRCRRRGRLQWEMQASSRPRLQLTSDCGHPGESGHTRMPWQPSWVLPSQSCPLASLGSVYPFSTVLTR